MNELAEATWRHWDFQHRHLGRLPYEEAFTDHNMVELGIRHPRQVTYRLFDRTWEAETGADFEWWIVDPVQRVLFPMLVQAKKMNRLGSYEDVGRRLGNDHARPLQIERLIEACRVGFTASQGQTVCAFIRYTPLYLFYNGPLQGQGGAASDRCRNSAVAREARGCSVAAAQDVRSALGDRVDLPAQDVRPVTLPWQCLLCCPTARVLGPGPLRVAGMLAGSAADGDGPWQYKVKLSQQAVKVSNPGILQVRRYFHDGQALADAIYDEQSPMGDGCTIIDPMDVTHRKSIPPGTAGEDLLVPLFRGGKRVYDIPSAESARDRARQQMAMFHAGIKRRANPHQYPVGLEEGLQRRETELLLNARRGDP
ncbi:hypothetical protein LCGC14_2655390 [marine sediment metagenome]|uniref:Nicotinate phosphoribosyltransferase C-terminal domain-containing protein n=1 Tax=marine sediment metagenome TaxID=412755 RepID=A0A0F8ZTN0_9ZZZZ